MNDHGSWYFTAPWEPIPIRRGDPLGFRVCADYFADLLAPDLSNATSDARWISLLSWCLKWSDVVWTKAGGRDLSHSEGQRARYAWLRPLELLWVDRALESGQKTGQLRGRRSVERWRNAERRPPNFAMSPDQFRRYRQVGTYGAYRVVLRNVLGLTRGDGWTPDVTGLALANLVNDSLPRNVRLTEDQFEKGTNWGSWSAGKDKEARYWVERGWTTSSAAVGGLLPTPDNAVSNPLAQEEERQLLRSALFGEGSIRRLTAAVVAGAKNAKTHADLCQEIANSDKLLKKLGPAIKLLPAFSNFADTAMLAMQGLWDEINQNGENQAPSIKNLLRSTELKSRLERLREASVGWLQTPDRSVFPHDQLVTRLAAAMRDATSPLDQLRVLERHHQECGGGRRWFRERAGELVPLVGDTSFAASNYRFRLRSLSRMAAQCGVADMNVALKAVEKAEFASDFGQAADDEAGDVL